MKRKTQAETDNDEEVLYGWKEIAKFIGCSTRNAQRLEKNEELPILRPDKRKKWRALALRQSLIAWMTGGVESAAISGSSLIAFDRRTRVMWSHEFSQPLRNYGSDELEWRLRVIDLKGNGERGVLFAARFLSPTHTDSIYWFSPTGRIEWQLEADPPLLDRNARSFDRAWVYTHILVIPEAKGARIWTAMANLAGWAGCILRVDVDASAVVQFANAGYVERLCQESLPGGNFLIACGENNDYDEAIAVQIGIHDTPACSVPGDRLTYRFANAPQGHPRKYILFPKTELIVARQKPYGKATGIAEHADGVIVEVETGGSGAHFRYHFSKDLEPRYVFPSGDHEFAHQQLERSGAIPHSWLNCPEMQAPLILRVWEPNSGWYDHPIPWRDNPWQDIRNQCR